MTHQHFTHRARAWARRFGEDQRGNVLMIVGLSLVPLTFATGMGIDYSRAMRLQTRLNAAADAAALSAVTQTMMTQANQNSCDTARQMFIAQSSGLDGLIFDANNPTQLTISLTDQDGNPISCTSGSTASYSRKATVTYSAKSTNAFAGILGLTTLPIRGSAQSYAAVAPNMDFYLALDTSPSMALPTTTDGIQKLDTPLTCSFACHSNKIEQYIQKNTVGKLPSPILDNTTFHIIKNTSYGQSGSGNTLKQKIDANGSYVYVSRQSTANSPVDSRCLINGKDNCVYNSDGTFVDSYWYALNQNIPLRVTAERGAVQDLMTLAQSYANTNKRTYHGGIWTFDHLSNLKTILAMPAPTASSNLADVSAAASKIDLVMVNDKAGNGRPPNGESGTEYLFTSFNSILNKMSTVLPATSGHGTDNAGDTPLGYLFLITDGMSDECVTTGSSCRTRSAMLDSQVAKCTAIKNRGFKIAILYTEYTTDSIKDDEPNQRQIATNAIPNIAPQLTKCASDGLMYTVKTDESISDALKTLFSKAIASARLMK
jgi:Flp pilus assembly protein TadG